MSAMGVFSRSFALFKASWGVLRHDKELLALPVISAVTSFLCVAPFVGLIAVTALDSATRGVATSGSLDGLSIGPLGYVLMFVAYLIGAYVTIFFQSALVLAANERLSGGEPTLGWAISAAASNAGRILPWAIISATVSIVLQAVQERAGFIGRIVVGLVGMAWTLVTFLVLPILVIEQVGVKDALSRSASAFKRTWGENVVGNGGIGLVMMLVGLLAFVLTAPVAFVGASTGNAPLLVLGVILVVVAMVAVSVLGAALSGVFRTALYRYAVLGEEPTGFTHDQIASAFRPKRTRGASAI